MRIGKAALTVVLAFWGTGALEAAPIESYRARIGARDHYSSRGVRLESVADILRQDRANVHRFGLADREDRYDAYFRTASRRAAIPRYLRRGWIEPGLAREILWGEPLIRVEVYPGYMTVSRVSPVTASVPSSAGKEFSGIYTPGDVSTSGNETVRSPKSISALRADALRRVERYGGAARFGFGDLMRGYGPIPLKHRIVGTYALPREEREDGVLVVTASSPVRHNDYHAASVSLSFFEYRKGVSGDAWRLKRRYPAALKYGSWGDPPAKEEVKILELAPKRYGVALDSSYVGQGWLERNLLLLLPDGERLREVLKLQVASDNGGTGMPPRTDWKAEYRPEPRGGVLYDLVVRRHGIEEGRPVDETLRYRFDPRRGRYLPASRGSGSSGKAEAGKMPVKPPGANFYSGTGDLIPGVRLPVGLERLRRLWGDPHQIIYPPAEDDSPMGQLYVWRFDGAELRVMADVYDRTRPDYRSKTIGAWLISHGGKAVPALCGAVLGSDRDDTVRRRIRACLSEAGGAVPIREERDSREPEYRILWFQDPRTQLFDLFYFRDGVLQKIWQGTVNPIYAD
jgi:hypothetical protein